MKLSAIAKALNCNAITNDTEIMWLLTDSRTLSFANETLFFAIHTARNDGHKYIGELYDRKVRFFVVEKNENYNETYPDAVFLHVNNSLAALQTLAQQHRLQFDIPIVGITGSNGKTIIKEWLYQLLHTDKQIVRSPRSFNSQIGVPLSVWQLNTNTELGIFEAGISQPNEMEKLARIIQPTIGIFSNLGDAHQENFESYSEKCKEKLHLFSNCKYLIFNADNQLIAREIEHSHLHAQIFSWGTQASNYLQIISKEIKQQQCIVQYKIENTAHCVTLPFTDEASIENLMHCICTLHCLGYQNADIQARMSHIEKIAMRLELKEAHNDCMIINDSYNSDMNSLSIALDFLNQQATDKNMERTVILSDMLQNEPNSDVLYSKIAKLLKAANIQQLIAVGENLKAHAAKFDAIACRFFQSTDELLNSKLLNSIHQQLILIKGSRHFQFEKLSARLERIAHETKLEVNLNALIHNFNYFKAALKPETKVMCMVKAFAYGSGAVEIARTLQHHKCDYLAVALADEGVELRNEGIRIPIVVMNPEMNSLDLVFDHALEPEIYSFRILKAFIAAAQRLGISNYPIHIKIDSGMHRLGFDPTDIDALIDILSKQQQLKIRSVFSHLAGADNAELDDFTHQQARSFEASVAKIKAAFAHNIFTHLLNSAGSERFAQYQFDMVRLGIGLYGVSANNKPLRQVCALKTTILQIKNIKAGETVGYSRNGKVVADTRIATIPIGYADGLNRRLSNGAAEVFVNGQRAKIIGNISMDLCNIDLQNIDAAEGDSVEIFGENISINELAATQGTIPYELLTSVSRRVKRVYYQE